MIVGRHVGAGERTQATPEHLLPPVATWQLRLFAGYCRHYLRRHFHRLHSLEVTPLEAFDDSPLLSCLNHPSWWDPIVAVYLSQQLFAGRRHYGPIAAAA